jgi:hypothetical protein
LSVVPASVVAEMSGAASPTLSGAAEAAEVKKARREESTRRERSFMAIDT